MYQVIIGRKKKDRELLGTKATVFLGKQYVTMGETTSLSNEVYLDVSQSHVMFVCGKRGSGKSYCIGAIAEGIMDLDPDVQKNLSMILLDTMGQKDLISRFSLLLAYIRKARKKEYQLMLHLQSSPMNLMQMTGVLCLQQTGTVN